jgi:molybdopterin/thiamine biosynthesis adenylyltransferase/rhodanese-related sulfurtransferase
MSLSLKYIESLKAVVKEVSVVETLNTLKNKSNAVLIDIRESEEINSGSPINSLKITKGMLEMKIHQMIKSLDTEIFLMCAGGSRSLIAGKSLLEMGFQNIFSVKGGFNEWKNNSLPFEIKKQLTNEELERYKRNILIPEVGIEGQQKILNSKVLIVGIGGIGSPIALYLAASGVGTIGIIDNDIVDKTNLQRQILHSESFIGHSKVESAKSKLKELNSNINIITYNERLNENNIERIFKDFDIVIDGTDNFNTRYLVNDACIKLNIPNIHGSIYMFEGHFTTFWPNKNKNTPCYRCLYPSPPPKEIAPSCAEVGVLGVLPGTIGVLCATEALKIILGLENMSGKLLVYNALEMTFDNFIIKKNKNCNYCNCKNKKKFPKYSNYSENCKI